MPLFIPFTMVVSPTPHNKNVKERLRIEITLFTLSKADSNHHKQNQNLLCYHYTIGQSHKYGCKGNHFLAYSQKI